MHSYVALASSLVSLALVSAIYYSNILSRPGSWLRGDMLAMILLSLLTVLLPLSVVSFGLAAWELLTEPAGLGGLLTSGLELVGLVALIVTGLVFRALVIATYRANYAPPTVRPLTPRPRSPRPVPPARRDAA